MRQRVDRPMSHPFKSAFPIVAWLILFSSLHLSGQASQQATGTITGTVVDRTGAVVAGAQIKLNRDEQTPAQKTVSGGDGQFSFMGLYPGPFQLTITATGFAAQMSSGNLQADEVRNLPPITLSIAKADTEVMVSPATNVEVAQE